MNRLRDEQTRVQFNVEIKNYYGALEIEETEQQPEAKLYKEWHNLNCGMVSTFEKCLPKKGKIVKKSG